MKKTKMQIFKSCQISAKYRFRTQIPSFKHHTDALNTVLGHEIPSNIVLLMLLESYKNVWTGMRGHKTSFGGILREKTKSRDNVRNSSFKAQRDPG